MHTAALWDAIGRLSVIGTRLTSSIFPPRIKRKDSFGSRLLTVQIGNPRNGPGYAQKCEASRVTLYPLGSPSIHLSLVWVWSEVRPLRVDQCGEVIRQVGGREVLVERDVVRHGIGAFSFLCTWHPMSTRTWDALYFWKRSDAESANPH